MQDSSQAAQYNVLLDATAVTDAAAADQIVEQFFAVAILVNTQQPAAALANVTAAVQSVRPGTEVTQIGRSIQHRRVCCIGEELDNIFL